MAAEPTAIQATKADLWKAMLKLESQIFELKQAMKVTEMHLEATKELLVEVARAQKERP